MSTEQQDAARDHAWALVVGESLVDVVHTPDGAVAERPGGSAANVAVALARLERPVRFASGWADDDAGRLVADHLSASGVALATHPLVQERTSRAVATIGADGAASYTFDLTWTVAEPDPALLEQAPPVVVHACSLGAVVAPGAEQVRALAERLRATTTVSYDVNARPAVTGTGADVVARTEGLVALADVVKASDEDLAALWPHLSLDDAARHLLDLGAGAVVTTLGPHGARVRTPSAEVAVAGREVAVADTIGAGDTFGAATLDALWARGLLGADARERLVALDADGWAAVLEHAAGCAAVTVSRPGADPPWRAEVPEPPEVPAR